MNPIGYPATSLQGVETRPQVLTFLLGCLSCMNEKDDG